MHDELGRSVCFSFVIVDVVKLFVKLGVNLNAQDWFGRTALHWAGLSENASLVEYLVDCGGDSMDNAGDIAADYIRSMGGRKLDLLVITHFHDDHANGVPQLLERVPVDAIAFPAAAEESPLKGAILSAAEEKQLALYEIGEDRTVTLEGESLRLFAPLGAGETNEEGLSVLATSGDFDVLITGDYTE